MEEKLPVRKRNRLEYFDYSSCGAYFITICTHNKKCLFWASNQSDFVGEDIILPPENVRLSAIGEVVKQSIESIPVHYPNIELWDYVIMPNHVHMILLIPDTCGRMISSPYEQGVGFNRCGANEKIRFESNRNANLAEIFSRSRHSQQARLRANCKIHL